jgi:hypothetical protein
MNIKGMLPALAVGISTGGAQASTKKKAAAGATASVQGVKFISLYRVSR